MIFQHEVQFSRWYVRNKIVLGLTRCNGSKSRTDAYVTAADKMLTLCLHSRSAFDNFAQLQPPLHDDHFHTSQKGWHTCTDLRGSPNSARFRRALIKRDEQRGFVANAREEHEVLSWRKEMLWGREWKRGRIRDRGGRKGVGRERRIVEKTKKTRMFRPVNISRRRKQEPPLLSLENRREKGIRCIRPGRRCERKEKKEHNGRRLFCNRILCSNEKPGDIRFSRQARFPRDNGGLGVSASLRRFCHVHLWCSSW